MQRQFLLTAVLVFWGQSILTVFWSQVDVGWNILADAGLQPLQLPPNFHLFYFEGGKEEEVGGESIFLDGVHAWAKTDLISPPFCGRSPSIPNLYSNLFSSQYQIRLRFNVHSMTMMMKHELTFCLEGFTAVSYHISMKNEEESWKGEQNNTMFHIPFWSDQQR